MNDFTKDELELIQNNLTWEECPDINLKLMGINNKIKSMIESYASKANYGTYGGSIGE